jgi:hypothetical protein
MKNRTYVYYLAAAVYIACREMGAHRTLDDIAAGSNVKRKEVSKNFRALHTSLDLKILQQDPMKCIAKVANKVKLSEKTKRKACSYVYQRKACSYVYQRFCLTTNFRSTESTKSKSCISRNLYWQWLHRLKVNNKLCFLESKITMDMVEAISVMVYSDIVWILSDKKQPAKVI